MQSNASSDLNPGSSFMVDMDSALRNFEAREMPIPCNVVREVVMSHQDRQMVEAKSISIIVREAVATALQRAELLARSHDPATAEGTAIAGAIREFAQQEFYRLSGPVPI